MSYEEKINVMILIIVIWAMYEFLIKEDKQSKK